MKEMKPLQILILVGAAAFGGAMVMRLAQQPRGATAEPSPVVAQIPPAPAVLPAVLPAPAAAPEAPMPPAPRGAPKPRRQSAMSAPPAVMTSPPPVSPPPVAVLPPVTPEAAPPSVPPAPPEPEHVTPPPPAPPEPHRVTLNAGTLLPVRLVDGLSAERNMPGDTFTATLDKELVVDGFVIAERGARVDGRVVSSDNGGRVDGVSSVAGELEGLGR